MKRGARVIVTGGESFAGTVLLVTAERLVIEVAPGVSTTLFRDFASTKPMQWQCAGLPVEVREKADLEEFRKLLWALEVRTRKY
jgi:preprotein translocase subunit YajC